MGRYIIELGLGADFHGQNVSKAAAKAVREAVSRSCLCGLQEVLGLRDLEQIRVVATVAVSRPEEVEHSQVAAQLPVGTVEVRPVSGGLSVPGLAIPRFGDRDDSIEIALAVVEVFIPGGKEREEKM